jgi:hypothetical protein
MMRYQSYRSTTGAVTVTVVTDTVTVATTTAIATTATTGRTMPRRPGITGTGTHRRGTIITPGTMRRANTAGANRALTSVGGAQKAEGLGLEGRTSRRYRVRLR